MNVDLAVTWEEAGAIALPGQVAVVIDVLRATSTIVAAFDSGAREVVPVRSVKAGRDLASKLGRERVVLCGERGGLRIKGYELGNSPLEYTREAVAGKTVLLTTTNGTRALAAALRADAVAAAALTNVGAVAAWLYARDEDLTIICAGTEGRLSLDDLYCGGMLISRLLEPGHVRNLSDGARTAIEWFVSNAGNAPHVLASCLHGQRLAALGFSEDLAYCAQVDSSTQVPIWNGRSFVSRGVPEREPDRPRGPHG
jgi:2-phosphosulfolactate phosphatase